MLTHEILRRQWPKAPQTKIDAICSIVDDVFAEFGIDDPKVVAQLMANISHENGGGTIVREKMYTHAERMVEIFGAPHSSAALTLAEAEQLIGKPQAFFDRVYNVPKSPKLAKELGNCAPGDGYRFRGGGDLQLTGRDSYQRIGDLVGVDLVGNPDMLADPHISFRVAVAEFVALKGGAAVRAAAKGRTAVVRRIVNGGNNGLAEVTVWVRKWEEALPGVEASVPAPRAADSTNKTFTSSKITQGGMATAGSLATGIGAEVVKQANTTTSTINVSEIADKVQTASDTISTVQVAADNATAVVHTVSPFLGLSPAIWSTITVVAITAAAVAIGFTLWERWKKLRDQGV